MVKLVQRHENKGFTAVCWSRCAASMANACKKRILKPTTNYKISQRNILYTLALGGDALKGKIDEPELGALPGCKLTSSPGQPLFDALAGSTPEVRLKIANVELAAILQVAKET